MNPALFPKDFGLPASTVLEQLDDNLIAIVINRKSRIIMADGKKVMDKINKIKDSLPQLSFALKTTAPVCSKTIQFLKGQGVQIIFK